MCTVGGIEVLMIACSTRSFEGRSIMRLCIRISNLSKVAVPSPQGDFLVVTFSFFVGRGIGPEIFIPADEAISFMESQIRFSSFMSILFSFILTLAIDIGMKKFIYKPFLHKVMSFLKSGVFLLVIVISLVLGSFFSGDDVLLRSGVMEPVSIDRIVDGDTFVFNSSYYRLMGINAPEKGERWSQESTDFLKTFEDDSPLSFESFGLDRYGRHLGYLWFNGVVLNVVSVKQGLSSAYYYDVDRHTKDVLAAEVEARSLGKGIWESSTDICGSCVAIEEVSPGDFLGDDCSSGGEFVKLSNSCDYSCSLQDWSIKDAATHKYTFQNFSLFPQQSALLLNGVGKDEPSAGKFFWNNPPSGACYAVLNDAGDKIFLKDREGALVDYYEY